ncbi:MAG: hypothetical protein JO033_16090, partial [Acidobacteriaceae bacterium]|nr:hypothetical protein [Acidobacteriaceae bacterium]
MAIEQTTTRPRLSLARLHELRALILKITGFCLLVWGSSLGLIGAFGISFGLIDLRPPGGGWRSVIDNGIKIGLAGGSLAGFGYLLALSGASIYNRGRRMILSSIRETLGHDPRPPVLYLRSFRDDPVTAEPTSILAGTFGIWTPTTKEEQVVRVLNAVGPVLAVGQPAEVLPKLDATRLQFSDHEWKGEVSTLMKRAIFTVIRAGTSGGLLWEIETAVSQTRPEQLILLIPFDQTGYERFAKEVKHLFPFGLPNWPPDHNEKPAKGATNRELDVKAVVYFDSSWRGIMVALPANEKLGASFDKAMQSFYPIDPKGPSLLRCCLTAVALISAFIAGLMLVSKSQTILELYKDFRGLHILSTTRVQQLAESSDPFLQSFSA